jgi:hypothetical protein
LLDEPSLEADAGESLFVLFVDAGLVVVLLAEDTPSLVFAGSGVKVEELFSAAGGVLLDVESVAFGAVALVTGETLSAAVGSFSPAEGELLEAGGKLGLVEPGFWLKASVPIAAKTASRAANIVFRITGSPLNCRFQIPDFTVSSELASEPNLPIRRGRSHALMWSQ